MYQAGLILEGGGMKGIYTAGVLEYFLENGIEFSSVYAVSAGACHMCSYLSKQKDRAKNITIEYLDSEHYCGKRSLLLTGNLFNVDMCYHTIPDYLDPYDYEAFLRYPGKAYSVVTNVVTGKAEYLRIRDMRKDIDKIRASASLPLVSKNVKIGDSLYLDGGIADPIPLEKSVLDGNQKNVVIMTKEEGFVRKPMEWKSLAMLKAVYLKYPKVYELMADRHIRYNDTVEYIERERQKGEVFLIRPKQASEVGRIERDQDKMLQLYQQGYEDARECFPALLQYLDASK